MERYYAGIVRRKNNGAGKEGNLQPFDISKEIYDRYEVQLKVESIPGDYDNLLITVEDRGIGMEEDCMAVISIIGTGWRGRRQYDRMIQGNAKMDAANGWIWNWNSICIYGDLIGNDHDADGE